METRKAKFTMNNVSLKGEDIVLNSGKCYYVLDVLYLNDIRAEFDNLQKDKLDQEIMQKVFPYTDAPFAKIKLAENQFQVSCIKKIGVDKLSSDNRNCFTSDTGLILFVEESLFSIIVKICNYDDLVDSQVEEINSECWNKITSEFPDNELGLILAPGVNSGYDFEGGGVYSINQNKTTP